VYKQRVLPDKVGKMLSSNSGSPVVIPSDKNGDTRNENNESAVLQPSPWENHTTTTVTMEQQQPKVTFRASFLRKMLSNTTAARALLKRNMIYQKRNWICSVGHSHI
jgi:hypothetical protein